jgi:hypothetical protein
MPMPALFTRIGDQRRPIKVHIVSSWSFEQMQTKKRLELALSVLRYQSLGSCSSGGCHYLDLKSPAQLQINEAASTIDWWFTCVIKRSSGAAKGTVYGLLGQ